MDIAISASRSISRAPIIIVLLLVAIISVGAVLRLAGIGSVGPESSDAFAYLNMGRLVATGFDAVVLGTRSISEVEGHLLNNPKPLHAFFIGTVMTMARDNHALWAGHLVGAIFGILTIPVVYVLGRQLVGVAVGLTASSVLAVSAYHVHYSRTAFAETDSAFFVYLALVLLIASWRARRQRWAWWLSFAAGVAAGLAMATNFRLAWVPAMILLFSVVRLVSRRRVPASLETINTSAILVGSLAPLILYGVPSYVIVRLFSNPFDPDLLVKWSYFHQLYHWIFVQKLSGGIQVEPLWYPRLWFMTDGYLPILLFGAGIFAVLRRRLPILLAALSIVVVPYLFHSITSNHAAQYFTVALPGLAIVGGCAVYTLPQQTRLGAAVALSVLILAVGIPMTWNQLRFSPSPYQSMVNVMKADGIRSHYTDEEHSSRFWFNRSYVLPLKDQKGLFERFENYTCPELEAEYALVAGPSTLNTLKRQGATIVAEAKFPPLPSVLPYVGGGQSRFEEHLEAFRSRFASPRAYLSLMTLCGSNR